MSFSLRKVEAPADPASPAVRAKSLKGNIRLCELALEHSLLWVEWQHQRDLANGPYADVVALNKQMVHVQNQMVDVLDKFKAALRKAEKRDG